MDCSNRFTFREFIVSYCTFELAWEVIKKTEDDDRTENAADYLRTGNRLKSGVRIGSQVNKK